MSGWLLMVLAYGPAAADDACHGREAVNCAERADTLLEEPMVDCMGGGRMACSGAGALMRFVAEQDNAAAVAAMQRACDLGSPWACARVPVGGTPLPADYGAAIKVVVQPDGFLVWTVGYGGGQESARLIPCTSRGTCRGPDDYDLLALSDRVRELVRAAGPGAPELELTLLRGSSAAFSLALIDALQRHPEGDLLASHVSLSEGLR